MSGLSEADLRIIAEEESLLARVRRRLSELEGRQPAPTSQPADLLELRDEAAQSPRADLPALFDQLHRARALAARRPSAPLPDRSCPYFAHLRLRENETSRDYLLGQASFLDTSSGLRIIDWRHAPLSQIFYRYREGDDFEEELPRRRAVGVVEARRVLAIVDGRICSIITPDGVLERDPASGGWGRGFGGSPALAGGQGTAERGQLGVGAGRGPRDLAPDITALLDPTQFDILERHGSAPLLILGIAGSGKTTVALHRLAILRHREQKRFPPKRLQVVVPESGLARLAVRMLARLGLGEVRVSTFSEWARRELGRLVPDFDRPVLEDAPPLVARLKRHRALLEALPRWLARHRPQSRVGIETLRFEICTDRDLLGEVVAAAGGELPRGAVEETARRTARQAEPRSEAAHAGTDRARLRAVDGASLDAGTPEEIRQTVDEEDLALLLEIWRLTRGPGARRRAHLVLDEAQELAAIELRALRQTQGEPPSVTVAGDDLQQTDPGAGFEGWDRTLEEIGAPDAARRELEVGYRCPLPIATLAQEILGPLARPGGAPSGRPGAPVGWHRFPSVGAAALFLQDALSDLLDREPNASVAVLTRDAEAARRWAGHLGTLPRLRWVRTGDFSFTPGIDVCEVALAKGLEFDYVVLPDAEASVYPTTDESRRLLHVAATRAMHQLWVCSIGTPSLVLPAQGGGPSPDHRPDE